MKKFILVFGIENLEIQATVAEAYSEEEAYDLAYNNALEIYQTYEGYHGILTFKEFIVEENLEKEDEEVAEAAYLEFVESYITYYVLENNEENLKKYEKYF